MEKQRDSRHEMTNLTPAAASTNGEGQSIIPNRASARLSDSDIRVADGFRPVSPLRPSSANPEISRPPPIRTLSTPQLNSENRNSIAKVHPVGLALSDELETPSSSEDQSFNPNTSRFVRSSSADTYDTASSPYHARISRISFSYPRRPPSAASSSIRPAHPYALYQQTTFEEPEEAELNVHTPPVGFPGRSQSYTRRIGPDGEEMAVVGPDGHTEELPPYSRYPMAGPILAKHTSSSREVVSPLSDPFASGSSSVAPSITSSPAIQTTETFQSINQNAPQASPISQTPTSQTPTLHNSATPSPAQTADTSDTRAIRSSASSLAEEKNTTQPKGWNSKKHRKVLCGTVPLWVVLLFAVLFISLAIIAGGVIGGLLSQQRVRQRHHREDKQYTVTHAASMHDAVAIAAPTPYPALPSGTFFFPLGVFGEQERRCIEPSRDFNAWSCSVTNQLFLIEFGTVANYPTAKIFPAPPAPGLEGLLYGAQPFKVTPTQKMLWVSDKQEPHRGPALHFQTVYDKVVLIEPEKFPLPEIHMRTQQKRDYHGPPPSIAFDPNRAPRHRLANSPGEEPWQCYWNATAVEGFIYVQQPVVGAETQQFTASRPSTETASPTSVPRALSSSSPVVTSAQPPPPSPNPQISPRAVLNPRSPGSRTQTGSPSAPTKPPTRFPLIVKIEERRIPNPAFQPYCKKMRVNEEGMLVPKIDSHGREIIEYIKEAPANYNDAQATTPTSHQKKGRIQIPDQDLFRRHSAEFEMNTDGSVSRRNEPLNACHCQWVTPFG